MYVVKYIGSFVMDNPLKEYGLIRPKQVLHIQSDADLQKLKQGIPEKFLQIRKIPEKLSVSKKVEKVIEVKPKKSKKIKKKVAK